MTKIWVSEDKSKDIIIAFTNNIIYKSNPKPELIDDYVSSINNNQVPNDVFGIPLSYIREINLAENTDYIEILFSSDSSEHFHVKNAQKRKEIFDFFQDNLENFTYKLDAYSPLKAAKKPLIALTVISLLFLCTLHLAQEIELGAVYEIRGHKGGLASVALMLALQGVQKVVVIFCVPIFITIVAIIKKAKNPPIIHSLLPNTNR